MSKHRDVKTSLHRNSRVESSLWGRCSYAQWCWNQQKQLKTWSWHCHFSRKNDKLLRQWVGEWAPPSAKKWWLTDSWDFLGNVYNEFCWRYRASGNAHKNVRWCSSWRVDPFSQEDDYLSWRLGWVRNNSRRSCCSNCADVSRQIYFRQACSFWFPLAGDGCAWLFTSQKITRMVVQDVKTNLILGEKIYFKGINMYWCKLASLLPGSTKITFYGVVAFHCVWCLLLPYIGRRKGAKVVKTNALSQILKSMVSRCWPSSDGSVLRVAMAQKCRLQRTQFRSVFPHLNPSTKKSQCEPYSFHQ